MCGIAFVSNIEQRFDDSIIKKMTESLHHRGPDAQGIETTKAAFLGHTRLQIIDPVGGTQPMWDSSGRYCLVFNGEIFNFRELRKELETLGNRFQTRSDTEVVLLAYRQWGPNLVNRLNGQFAFAVFDTEEQSVFAARDRMGENPLFWAQTDSGEILIASEIKAILAANVIQPKIDMQAVDAYLKLVYVPPHQTIYRNVHSLSPGCWLKFRKNRVETGTYWRPKLSTDSIDEYQAVQEIRRLIAQSVERQMVADTEVGAFLSGGLDSTTIVGLMSGLETNSKVKTFAVGFGDLINELPYAKAVADQYKTQHYELQMDIDVAQMLDTMVDVYDQPFGDSSNIPTYLVSQFASRHVKVVLSGDGGDELFGGYSWYRHLLEQTTTDTSQRNLFNNWLASKLGFGSIRKNAKSTYRHLQRIRAPHFVFNEHLARLSVQSPEQRNAFSTDLSSSDQDIQTTYFPSKEYPSLEERIDEAAEFDIRCYLPGDIFAKVDRASMANGLETRSPFMDVELVEFVLSLPARMRFSSFVSSKRDWSANKWLLRKSCKDLWPKEIVNRTKQGFGAPIKNWLQKPEIQKKMDRVLSKSSPMQTLFPGISESKIQGNNPEQARWNILCLGLWLEKHEQCLNHLK